MIGRNRERLDATLQDLRAVGGGRHIGSVLDAAAPDDMAEMAEVCAQTYGRADLLVFSAVVAGYEEITRLPPQMLDLPLVAWRKALDVNLHGVFLSNRAVLPLMIQQGQGDIYQYRVGADAAWHARPRSRGLLLRDKIRARCLHALPCVGGLRAWHQG